MPSEEAMLEASEEEEEKDEARELKGGRLGVVHCAAAAAVRSKAARLDLVAPMRRGEVRKRG